MRLDNRTAYSSADLRALLLAVGREELPAASRARLIVRVVYTRGGGTSGCAYVGRKATDLFPARHASRMTLRLPRPPYAVDVVEAAHVAGHEMAHLRGLHHRDMPSQYRWAGPWRDHFAYAAALPVRVAEPVVPAPVDREAVKAAEREARLAAAQAKVALWARAAERARRRAAKWSNRARSIERTIRVAALRAAPKEPA